MKVRQPAAFAQVQAGQMWHYLAELRALIQSLNAWNYVNSEIFDLKL